MKERQNGIQEQVSKRKTSTKDSSLNSMWWWDMGRGGGGGGGDDGWVHIQERSWAEV